MVDPLSELRVEAGTALLDEDEVEAGGVGDRLQMVGRAEIVVAAGNRPTARPGTACGSLSPKSGFCESLR
jgi:hypothetical protein